MRINIHARVRNLVRKYGTRDPIKIAREIGIRVIYWEFTDQTKGYFVKMLRNRFIVINSLLDETSRQIVAAHELGHALLHSSCDLYWLREYTLFPVAPYEQEANSFAAELLIDEKELDEYMLLNMSSEDIASYFSVPVQLIEYKLMTLPKRYITNSRRIELRI